MRRYPNENANLCLGVGDYGQDDNGVWHVRPPGCHAGDIPVHKVEEHPDGTITVTPSIRLHDADGKELYHGHLRKGEWVKA